MIKLKNGITAGKHSRTLLSALLGYNSPEERNASFAKLDYLACHHSNDINIIGDVSMCISTSQDSIWMKVLHETPFAAATVPVYQCYNNGCIERARLLELMDEQAESGVSIITIHPTASRQLHDMAASRIIPCTSRGGAMVYHAMCQSGALENIFMETIDEVALIARKYKVVLSLGSTYRSGSTIDSFDEVYKRELSLQFEISDYLQRKGVSTIIETPGHADINAIESICKILAEREEPIMPLGPIPTDIALNYDDLAACIGAVTMGSKGCADILTIVTKEEHSGGIPSLDSLCEAIQKYKVTAHIIDMVKVGDKDRDYKMSKKRSKTRSCTAQENNNCNRCSYSCPLRI